MIVLGQRYVDAAQDLADARVRFWEQFLLHRTQLGKDGTDRQAEAMAILDTKDEITVLTAVLRVEENKLK